MDPDSSLLLNILLLLFLVACNAFFAMSEIAVISLNDNKIKKMASEGHKKAATILRLIEQPSRFLATIQVGVTLSGFLASAVAADTFSEYIVLALRNAPVSPATVRGVSIVIITIVLSYFTLVFGELVPKRAAMQNYEKISYAVAPLLRVLAAVGRPFVALLSSSTNAILRLFGINPDEEPDEVTEEEIRMMIDVGNERGSIEESEKEMLNNIFELDDRTVSEMMTHRTEVAAIETGTPLGEVIKLAVESGYSRIPVYEDDLDSIIGILYVKDLLGLVTETETADFNLQNYMREPLYVLENNTCTAVLAQFKARKVQIAVVVDEYGGTSGVVSMEDLLESIVGNIQDEYDDEEEDILLLAENRFLVDGLTSLEDVDKYFNLDLDDDEEFETIGGYVLNQLGRIPSEDEHPSVELEGYRFIVSEMDERRVAKLEVERLLPEPAAETKE